MEQYIKFFEKNYKGDNIEWVLLNLRQLGASQMETAMILCKQLKIRVGEADKIVNNSAAWKDRRELNNKFRSEFGDFMDSITQEPQ